MPSSWESLLQVFHNEKQQGKRKRATERKREEEPPSDFPDVWWNSPTPKSAVTDILNNGCYGSDANAEEVGGLLLLDAIDDFCARPTESDRLLLTNGASYETIDSEESNLVDRVKSLFKAKPVRGEDVDDERQLSDMSSTSHGEDASGSSSDNVGDWDDDDDDDNRGSSCSYSDNEEEDGCDEIAQPPRTLGLIFFDFVRCVAVSANIRCINTELFPLFLVKLDPLSVAVRIFITMFSLLLILVEFPDLCPCLQHAPSNGDGRQCKLRSDSSSGSSTSLLFQRASAAEATIKHQQKHEVHKRRVIGRRRLGVQKNLTANSDNGDDASSYGGAPIPWSSHNLIYPATPSTPPLYVVNWIPRGILYIFLGLITLEQSIIVLAQDQAKNASISSRFFDGLFVVISGWLMLAVGIMYVFFGMCCLQKVMERIRREDEERWYRYYTQIDELEDEIINAEEREIAESSSAVTDDILGGGGWVEIAKARCWLGWRRYWRGCDRRKKQWNRTGLCWEFKCRTIKWKW